MSNVSYLKELGLMLGWNGRTKDWMWDDGNKLGPSEIHDYLNCVDACSIHI
jgi:hypothetical protein